MPSTNAALIGQWTRACLTLGLALLVACSPATGNAPSVNAVEILPTTLIVVTGATLQLAARATFGDGSAHDVTGEATWSSHDDHLTVTATGLVTGLTEGDGSVSVSFGGASATTLVRVLKAPTSLILSPQDVTLNKGETVQLTVLGRFADGSSQDVTASALWASSAPDAASISTTGLVRAMDVGASTVSATFGPLSVNTTITVAPASLTALSLLPSDAIVPLGATLQLIAVGTFSTGSSTDVTPDVAWTSAAASVATVSSTGEVLGLKRGTTLITASKDGLSSTLVVTVGPPVLTAIELTAAPATVYAGSTLLVTATGTYSDETTSDVTANATWSTDNPAVATTPSRGHVLGVAVGTAQVSARMGAISASLAITVLSVDLVSITITPETPTVSKGSQIALTAKGSFTDSSTSTITSTVTWTSITPSIATVDMQGGVRGVAVGVATITATRGGLTATKDVTITPAALASLALANTMPACAVGQDASNIVIGTNSDGSTADLTSTAVWTTSSSTRLALLSSGRFHCAATGTASMTAAVGAVNVSANVTISAHSVTSIEVTSAVVPLGGQGQAVATATYTDQLTGAVTNSATWSSSNDAIATVSSSGLVRGVAMGTVTLTATLGSVSGALTLTVGPPALVSVAITETQLTCVMGREVTATATGTFTDGSTGDVTATAEWTPVSGYYLSLVSPGRFHCLNAGGTSIQATIGALQASRAVTVGNATLVSIAISPGTISLAKGQKVQLGLWATWTDDTVTDRTGSATWTLLPSPNSVVSIDSSTQLYAAGMGTATVRATYQGLSVDAAVTVGPAIVNNMNIGIDDTTFAIGVEKRLGATAYWTDGGSFVVTNDVTWTSLNPSIVAVTADNKAKGVAVGMGYIQGTYAGITKSFAVSVTPAIVSDVSLSWSGGYMYLPISYQYQMKLLATYTDGAKVDITSLATWTSSTPQTVSVTSNTYQLDGSTSWGLIEVAPGASSYTNITARYQSQNYGMTLWAQPTPSSFIITPSQPVAPLLGRKQLFAKAGSNTEDLTRVLDWTSSDTTVATVTNNVVDPLCALTSGCVVPVSPGTTTICAVHGATTGCTTVTVLAP